MKQKDDNYLNSRRERTTKTYYFGSMSMYQLLKKIFEAERLKKSVRDYRGTNITIKTVNYRVRYLTFYQFMIVSPFVKIN